MYKTWLTPEICNSYDADIVSDTSTKDVWFEAHKVPREAWVSELEAIETKLRKRKEKEQKEMVNVIDVSCLL